MNKIISVAKPHGFCGNNKFGVIAAIEKAKQAAKQFPGKVYMLGEIVHNQHVVDELKKECGVKIVASLDQIPNGEVLIIRAHGAIPEIFKRAKEKKLKIVDATCPLVTQAHKEILKLASQGKKIVYVASKKNHDEAVGAAGEAPECVILTTLKELKKLEIENPKNTVLITQTTLSTIETETELKSLHQRYPDLTIKPHICPATTDRQKAVIALAKQNDLVIIVGSPTSSNSNRLKDVVIETGGKAYIVDTADELRKSWFEGKEKIAVSSGASTP